MRTVLLAAATAAVVAVLFLVFAAPTPMEPAKPEVDEDILERVDALEHRLAARDAEEEARLRGTADAAEALRLALASRVGALEAKIEASAAKLTDVEALARSRAVPVPVEAKEAAKTPPVDDEMTRKQVDQWIGRLEDENENVRFSSTLELGRLKHLRAAPALVEVLQEDRDYYVRLGAATALGEIKACAAVPALIEALDDKDTLVRTAANDALRAITGHSFEFQTEMDSGTRQDVMRSWQDWWRANEQDVRKQLGQAGS